MQSISSYKAIVFDCDGVILDSNHIKTEAFMSVVAPYGRKAAEELVRFHQVNGGVSRYKKFAYFLNEIFPKYGEGCAAPDIDQLLDSYARCVRSGLKRCSIALGLSEFREATRGASWFVVSGGDQSELREVFAERGIDYFFDGGIFGSPDTKEEILKRELKLGRLQKPALFIGDSRYDHVAASKVGLDFVFLCGWSEMPGWRDFVKVNGIRSAADLLSFLKEVEV